MAFCWTGHLGVRSPTVMCVCKDGAYVEKLGSWALLLGWPGDEKFGWHVFFLEIFVIRDIFVAYKQSCSS